MYPHAIFLADPYTLDKDIEQALLFFLPKFLLSKNIFGQLIHQGIAY
jgi:hypothetical protein